MAVEQRPRMRRWILAALLLGGLGCGAIWGASWLLMPASLPLERIRVEGEIRHTREELLKRTLAGRLQGGFFSLDLQRVRAAVEDLPWVTLASVRRIWPGTLVVWVKEREALARWGDEGVVSPEGVIFVPEPGTVPRRLAWLSGPADSAPEVVDAYQRLRQRFGEQGMEITRLALSGRHAWSLTLADGMQLHLGNTEVEQRLQRFLKHLPELRRQGTLEQVDARYANGFAVRWQAQAEILGQQQESEG